MKTVRTRVKSAFRRNSKGIPLASPSVPLKLPAASSSAPSLISVHDKVDGTSAPPVSPVTPSEKDLPMPFHLEPLSESPTTEKHVGKPEGLDLAGLTFTGEEPELVHASTYPIPISDDSRRSTPKKRIKSVPRVSSDYRFPSPSFATRIQTTLPPSKDHVEEVKFVSPVDPNYLIDEIRGLEPRLLDQPAPTDRAFVESTPKELRSSLPPLNEVLAHQAHLKRLDSNIPVARAASIHEAINEEKPLLDADVDEILDSVWPLPAPSFPSLGWTEHILPSSAYYYSHAASRTVTDIDLRDEKKLAAVRSYLYSKTSTPVNGNGLPNDSPFRHFRGDSTPRMEDGVDLWLRDVNPVPSEKDKSEWKFMPMRNWVLHATRVVTFDPPSERDGFRSTDDLSDEDRLDHENRYWQYMSTHPAHASLPQTAHEEAMEVLTWCYADRVLCTPQPLSAVPPFTQRECVDLLELLRNVSASTSSTSSSVTRTRIVAQILLRYTEWRQKYVVKLNDKQITSLPRGGIDVEYAIPFRKTLLRFIKAVLCLGIPYLYETRGSGGEYAARRADDEEQGNRDDYLRSEEFELGSSQIFVAALLLSASVTFLALPGLNGTSRVAALISTLCSSASMVSYVITLLARSHRHNRSRNATITALPLVMLAYSLCAFVTGIIAYSLAGSVVSNRAAGGFGRYTGWVVVGVSIALVAVLASSAAVTKKGL